MATFLYRILKIDKYFYAIWLLFAILLFVFISFKITNTGHPGDISFWVNWSIFLKTHSFSQIYTINCDYMPLYLYVLKAYAFFQHNLEDFNNHLYFLKLFTLVFDFLTAFLLANLLKDRIAKLLVFIGVLASISFVYNTLFWVQIDAIHTFFCFLFVLLAYRKKWSWAMPILLIAINIKLQSILLLSIAFMLLLFDFKWQQKEIFKGVLIALFLQLLIVFPFILEGNLNTLFATFLHPFQQNTPVSFAAANIWFLINWVDIYGIANIATNQLFLGFSLKFWGNLMFFTFSISLLLFYGFYHFKKKEKIHFESLMALCSLVCFAAFFFSTGMHERYIHIAIPFVVGFSIQTKKVLPAVLILLGYFLNLELILGHFGIFSSQTIPMLIQAIALLYLAVMLIILTYLIK